MEQQKDVFDVKDRTCSAAAAVKERKDEHEGGGGGDEEANERQSPWRRGWKSKRDSRAETLREGEA